MFSQILIDQTVDVCPFNGNMEALVTDVKVCSKCHETKVINEFSWRDRKAGKRRSDCKVCVSKHLREYRDSLVGEKREKRLEYNRECNRRRRAEGYKSPSPMLLRKSRKDYARQYARDNKEKLRIQRQGRRAKINTFVRVYRKKRMKDDLVYRLSARLRDIIRKAIRRYKGRKKSLKTFELLGCSPAQLKVYTESLWLPNMNWGNYGSWRIGRPMTWHLDHIRPISSFDITDPLQQKACFHYTNLQPLWAIDNMIKGSSVPETKQNPSVIN